MCRINYWEKFVFSLWTDFHIDVNNFGYKLNYCSGRFSIKKSTYIYNALISSWRLKHTARGSHMAHILLLIFMTNIFLKLGNQSFVLDLLFRNHPILCTIQNFLNDNVREIYIAFFQRSIVVELWWRLLILTHITEHKD